MNPTSSTLPHRGTTPLSAKDLLDRYFIENRSRLIDLAAYLDRVERSAEFNDVKTDLRWIAIHNAIGILSQKSSSRVQAIQVKLSDPSIDPLAISDGRKSATGAC